jgi:hypothetical protein
LGKEEEETKRAFLTADERADERGWELWGEKGKRLNGEGKCEMSKVS